MLEKVLLRNSRGAQVKAGDRVFVRYQGQLLDGSIFDRNFDFSEFVGVQGRDVFSFVLGQGQVIQGWELGLNGARLGQVLKLVIPPELAYGNTARPGIPANSALEFTVEVLGFNKGDNSTPVGYELADVGIKLSKFGLSDAIRGLRTANSLLNPPSAGGGGGGGDQGGAQQSMAGVDYSGLYNLLAQRSPTGGLLGTQYQPQPLNLASLLG